MTVHFFENVLRVVLQAPDDRLGSPILTMWLRERRKRFPLSAQKVSGQWARLELVGGYALRYALANSAVRSVTSVGRKKRGITHPKPKEVLHQNFADCSSLADALSGQDAVVYGLGTYTGSLSGSELGAITADYTIEFARVLRGSSPNAALSFLSGNGADPTGRSRLAFARYKGQAENALFAGGFHRVYIFPARVYLPRGATQRTQFSYRLLRAVYPIFRVLFPNQLIRADDLRRVMADVAIQGTVEGSSLVFENRDIGAMVESFVKQAGRAPKHDSIPT